VHPHRSHFIVVCWWNRQRCRIRQRRSTRSTGALCRRVGIASIRVSCTVFRHWLCIALTASLSDSMFRPCFVVYFVPSFLQTIVRRGTLNGGSFILVVYRLTTSCPVPNLGYLRYSRSTSFFRILQSGTLYPRFFRTGSISSSVLHLPSSFRNTAIGRSASQSILFLFVLCGSNFSERSSD
jgi:hypothetical protein